MSFSTYVCAIIMFSLAHVLTDLETLLSFGLESWCQLNGLVHVSPKANIGTFDFRLHGTSALLTYI